MPAGFTTKANAHVRLPSASTGTYAPGVARMGTLREIVQRGRLEEFRERGERLKRARDFLWERGEKEMGPTSLYSLTAKPLPRPPDITFEDEVRMKTIRDHPELFKITCVIDVDTFEKLLVDHPNQPFVQSVLVGLRKGFWPFADTTKDGFPKTWDGSSRPPKTERERDFMSSQARLKLQQTGSRHRLGRSCWLGCIAHQFTQFPNQTQIHLASWLITRVVISTSTP